MKKNFNRKKQFNSDLEWGKWGEQTIIPFIEQTFKQKEKSVSYWYSSDDVTKNKKELKEWDLRFGVYDKTYMNGIDFIGKLEFEIKTDKYPTNTGNLIFEKSCNRKPSGVFATKAKFFIYFLPLFKQDNIYLIKSEKLRTLLEKYPNDIVSGGDYGSNTMMYKISRNDFDIEFKKAGGIISSWTNYTIPEQFNIKEFNQNHDVYYSDKWTLDDEDPFDFEGK